MARYVSSVNGYRVYELDQSECKQFFKPFPTFVCWREDDCEIIGNALATENEAPTIPEMVKWCKSN